MASSGELRIEVEQDAGPSGSLTVVRATGEVDLTNADDLERALAAADGALVLDLTGVGFMDSSGLRVLLVKAQQPEPRFALVLRHGSPVLRLIELSEVQDRLPWFESETDAIAAAEPADGADG
jgi:anti-sigma B factor antagonist